MSFLGFHTAHYFKATIAQLLCQRTNLHQLQKLHTTKPTISNYKFLPPPRTGRTVNTKFANKLVISDPTLQHKPTPPENVEVSIWQQTTINALKIGCLLKPQKSNSYTRLASRLSPASLAPRMNWLSPVQIAVSDPRLGGAF